jgi:PleD family two-component response regulator
LQTLTHNWNGGAGIPRDPDSGAKPARIPAERSFHGVSGGPRRAKVLLADADPFIRTVLPKGLREEFEVVLARDGIDALTLFLRERPDLLILGMSLAEVSAFEICRALRAHAFPQPIFMLSNHFDPAERARGLSLGATDFIGQPLQVREVVERLRAAVRRFPPATLPSGETADVEMLLRAARNRVLPFDAFRDRLAEACDNVLRFGASLGVVRIRWNDDPDPRRTAWLCGELERNTRPEDLVALMGESEAVVVLPTEGRAGTIGFLRKLRRRWESLCGSLCAQTMPAEIRVGIGVVLPARDLRPPSPVSALASAVACHDLFENPLFASERAAVTSLDPSLTDGIDDR